MKTILTRVALISFLIALLIPSSSFAETKTIIKEYTYQASEADSKLTSRVIALEQAKRQFLEELGAYLVSHTEVVNYQLSKDQIHFFTAGIVKTKIIKESWDGKTCYVQTQMPFDSDTIVKKLANIKNNQQKSEELEDVRKKADTALKEIARIKESICTGSGSKKALKETYKKNIAALNDTNWMNVAFELQDNGKLKEAIEAFSNVIELYPKNIKAYENIATAYTLLGNNEEVIIYTNKALALKPDTMYNQ
jgi:tetratricopeptide (TPR) repeat protein